MRFWHNFISTKQISTNSSVNFKTSSNAANKVYSVLFFCLCNVCLFVLRLCQTCVREDRRDIGCVNKFRFTVFTHPCMSFEALKLFCMHENVKLSLHVSSHSHISFISAVRYILSVLWWKQACPSLWNERERCLL